MAQGRGYKIEGGAELAAGLRAAAKALDQLDHDGPNAIMAGAAAGLAPVDTGYLAGSIAGLEGEGGIYSDAEYAALIEFGWAPHNIEPEPYAVPGVKGSVDEWLPIYVEQVQTILSDVKGA